MPTGKGAGAVLGDVWAECSVLETEGCRDTMPNSSLRSVSSYIPFSLHADLLSFLMSLEKIGSEECLAAIRVLADHCTLLRMVPLVTPTTSS